MWAENLEGTDGFTDLRPGQIDGLINQSEQKRQRTIYTGQIRELTDPGRKISW